MKASLVSLNLNLNLKLSLMGRGECATSSEGREVCLDGLLGFSSLHNWPRRRMS